MSNSTFKSVKNLKGVLSELNVSGDAQVHGAFSVGVFDDVNAANKALGTVAKGTIVFFSGKLHVWNGTVWEEISSGPP